MGNIPEKVTSAKAPDALRAALVEVIVQLKQDWRSNRQAIEAEARASIAEARGELAAVRADLEILKTKYEAALDVIQARTVAFVPPDVPARQAHVIPPGNWS